MGLLFLQISDLRVNKSIPLGFPKAGLRGDAFLIRGYVHGKNARQKSVLRPKKVNDLSTRSGATAEGVICRRATKDLETWRRDPILYQPHDPASHGPGTQEASRGCAAVESPLVHQPGLCHLKARLGLGDPLPRWLPHVAGGFFPCCRAPCLLGWAAGGVGLRTVGWLRAGLLQVAGCFCEN